MAVRRATPLTTRVLLLALRSLSVAAGFVPRHRGAEPLCRLAGLVWYLTAPATRAAVRDNLRHVLGRPPRRREIAAVFQHGAMNYWDTFAIPHFSHRRLLELVNMRGFEMLDTVRAEGRGAIVAGAHLGSVALVGQILPALGHPTIGLVEAVDSPELFEVLARQRQALGVRLIPATASALRELLAALRRNEVVGLVTDRDVTGTGPTVSFFGAPTQFPSGAAALSVRTGAPILIGISVRRGDGRFDALLEPLPDVPGTGDAPPDVLQLTQAVAKRLEYHIGSHPEQWTVFQRRWPPQAHAG